MRYIFGFILIFVLSILFSYFQGFIDFLINLGVFPDKYKNSANFDIMMIFVLYVIFMTTAFAVVGVMMIFGRFFDWKFHSSVKNAKKQAIKEYGTPAPYFYLLDPNTKGIHFDKSCYVHETYEAYLYKKYQDWDKVKEVLRNSSNLERLEFYHEAVNHFRLPDIPKEYGIFGAFTDEELAQFGK